jgi:hypothetical protein
MVPYAPAWLRRRRRSLVPILTGVGVAAFAALAWLPRFEASVVEHGLAILAGVTAWTLLYFLLNGDPLPQHPVLERVAVDPASAVMFDVHSGEADAMRAQAEFWLRSLRELRLGSVAVAPVVAAFYTAVALKLFPGSVVTIFLGFMTVLSLVMPVVLFLVGRRGAAAQARRFPDRRILVGANGISIGMGEVTEALGWSSFPRVWEMDHTLALVLHPYVAILLPRAQVPPAAREIILSHSGKS